VEREVNSLETRTNGGDGGKKKKNPLKSGGFGGPAMGLKPRGKPDKLGEKRKNAVEGGTNQSRGRKG